MIACKNLNKNFNFEYREKILNALLRKICNLNGNRSSLILVVFENKLRKSIEKITEAEFKGEIFACHL